MADYDAIVVGAGCAGSVAAYELASAGKNVLLIDRGIAPGNKNMTGGRIYTHSLNKIFGDCAKEAPFERRVTHERISLMSQRSDFTVDFSSESMDVTGEDSYTVLRAKFDPWLASKAVDAGAKTLYGSPVTALTKDATGKVTGAVVDGQTYTCDVMVLADGINSLLVQEGVGAANLKPEAVAVGLKEVIALPANVITDRCNTNSDDEGTAWMFAGDATEGLFGGGFVYANRESISVGLVVGMETLVENADTPVYQMLENFKQHPSVAAVIKGGEVVEYSGHVIPEGGIKAMPALVGEGVLIAGDNAMMCMNLGFQVRGMDFAIEAGHHAGKCAAEALDRGDTSREALQTYVKKLENCFIMEDLYQYEKTPQFLEDFSRMFDTYPDMVRRIMNDMFIVKGTGVEPIGQSIMPIIKNVGIFHLLKDMRGAMKNL